MTSLSLMSYPHNYTYDDLIKNVFDENSRKLLINPSQLNNFKLFEHQKTMIANMIDLERTHTISIQSGLENYVTYTNLGILADEVGAGKTMEMLGIIACGIKPTSGRSIISNNSEVFTIFKEPINNITESYHGSLILVPHTLLHQWENNIKLTHLKYYKIHSKKTLEAFSNEEYKSSDIVLLSSTFAYKAYDVIKTKNWDRFVIDEPQQIVKECQLVTRLTTLFTWLLCATPESIIRTPAPRSVFKQIFARNLHSFNICLRNNSEYIKQSISLPQIITNIVECLTPVVLRHLSDSIPKEVFNLMNAGCQNEALRILGCKSNTIENISETIIDKIKEKIQDIDATITYTESRPNVLNKEDKINKLLSKRNKELTKINGIRERLENIRKDNNCNICFDECDKPVTTPCCQHLFCLSCIINSYKYKPTCPYCREPFQLQNIYNITDKANTSENDTVSIDRKPRKIEALENILNTQDESKRYLVFSSYSESFEEIKKYFIEKDIKLTILKGSSNRIKKILREYENGEIKVILLNSSNFGAGLNIQMTSDLIIYHKIDNQLEKQVIGRAQRCGRTCPLNVHYLKYDTE